MAAPIVVKMFPSVVYDNSEEKCHLHQRDTEFDLRNDLFGVRIPGKSYRCLLMGKRSSGRTSLLFQCALSSALEGRRVILITHSKFQTLPLCVYGAPQPEPLLMKQIHILYHQDRSSVLEYLARIQTFPVLPDVIIIDDLDFYATHPKTQDTASTVAKLCAYLVDTATFIETQRIKIQESTSKNNDQDHRCLVIGSVSMTTNGEVSHQHIYESFLPTVLRISGVAGTDNVHQLSLHPIGTAQSNCTITYEIKDSIRLLDYNTGEAAFGISQEFSQETE
ncbi:uncharacterized protein [Asterias amurensis]|uniref:uncharacterized protein n=1 Tax=Asterias amurensis TaxID=7602 RepID=UPI003AB3CCDF